MLSIYPACFFKEGNQYSVVFPDLNALSTCGDSVESAFEMAIDCLAGYLYGAKQDGTQVPAPSPLSAIDLDTVAQETYGDEEHPAECFVNMVAVDVAEYAKIHFERSVKKTADHSCPAQ